MIKVYPERKDVELVGDIEVGVCSALWSAMCLVHRLVTPQAYIPTIVLADL